MKYWVWWVLAIFRDCSEIYTIACAFYVRRRLRFLHQTGVLNSMPGLIWTIIRFCVILFCGLVYSYTLAAGCMDSLDCWKYPTLSKIFMAECFVFWIVMFSDYRKYFLLAFCFFIFSYYRKYLRLLFEFAWSLTLAVLKAVGCFICIIFWIIEGIAFCLQLACSEFRFFL